MAEELIPPAIRNGGTGPAPTAGSVTAPVYQPYSPEELLQSRRVDAAASEAGEANAAKARALGGLFKEFEGISGNVLNEATTQAGALAGAASGNTGHPDYKAGFARFTAYGRAFNNAATGAYAIEAEAQADDTAARLRVQANNNPATFAATYTAARDAVLKEAPPMAVPMLTELYNKRLAAGLAAISGDQAAEQRNLQRQVYDTGVDRQASRVAALMGDPDPAKQAAAADEQVKLSLLINGGATSGLYSDAEAQAMHIGTARKITAQVFETQFDRTLAGPDGAVGAVTLLENFQKAHLANLANTDEPAILSESEYQKLYADGVTKLREYNLGIASLKRDGKTAEQLKFEQGDQLYTSMFLSGQLTDRALDAAVRTGDLKPERATSLHSMMNNGADPPKSDPVAYGRLLNDPRFPQMSTDEIAAASGISRNDKLNLIREQERQRNNWEGTQVTKEARSAISAALKILPGTPAAALFDDQRRALTDANQEFTQLMNATDPAARHGAAPTIAQQVIQHAKQREATADTVTYTNARARYVEKYGPTSDSPQDKAKYEARLKYYDDLINQSRAAAKGQ